MSHPSSLDLEAFAVGEPLPAHLAGHIEECGACGAFLEELRGVVTRGPSAKEADDAVARAVATLSADADIDAREPARSFVDPLDPLEPAEPLAPAQQPKRKPWLVAASRIGFVAPLAVAAAVLLLMRSPSGPLPPPPSSAPGPGSEIDPRAPTTYKIQMGTLPPRVANASDLGTTSGASEPDTQFKGGMQVAVVRDRGGAQTRFSSTVRVRPGDRLRVEVALDHEQAILGAVLADDGSYLELMPQAVRGPGTHFSERSAKIDAAPTRGTIIIGSPEAVARARDTKDLAGVRTLRVELEAP